MSITTYAELQTALSSWLHRTDVSTVAADLIKFGENTLNRKLRLFQMENVDTTITTSTSDRFATLPTGFIEAIDLTLYDDSYPQVLTQLPLSRINGRATDISTKPHYFAISNNIIFDVISDEAYDCALRYYKKFDIATDLTNWLLTNYPEAYLYATLAYSTTYLRDPGRIQEHRAFLDEIIRDLNRLDARSRGQAKMMVEPGLRMPRRSDIISGDEL